MLSAPLQQLNIHTLPRCVDCEELVALQDTVSAGGGRCATRRCKKCHGSRKSVRQWYVNARRLDEWDAMTVEQRRDVIVQNKDKGLGRGIKRKVQVGETAECVDKVQLSSEKPFLTKKQFLSLTLVGFQIGLFFSCLYRCLVVSGSCFQLTQTTRIQLHTDLRFLAELEKRYDWTDEQMESEWTSAKSNPLAVWTTDDYGEPVVSLLRVASANTSREMNHRKGVTTSNTEETADLENTFQSISAQCLRNFRYNL